MKILHLAFHPDLTQSRVNKNWYKQIESSGKASISRDMYQECSNWEFEVNKEQGLLVQHDRIVLQFPFYWYATPPLLKKWLDDTLTYNFAYGTKGDKLAGKELQLIVSVGGPELAYMPGGYNNFSVTEFLRPLQQTATLCRMTYLPPMWMSGSVAADEQTITAQGQLWVEQIDNPDRADPWQLQKRIIAEAK